MYPSMQPTSCKVSGWTLLALASALTPSHASAAPSNDSARCRGCHPAAYEAWSTSHHALADQPPPELLRPPGSGALEVTRILGVDPIWQPVLRTEDGHEQVYDRAFDVRRGEWFLAFDAPRPEGSWSHWRGRGMRFDTMCLECHDTGVTRGYQPGTDTYAREVAERGVGCAACHGEADAHVSESSRPVQTVAPDVETCGPCHSRRASLLDGKERATPMLDRYMLLTAGGGGRYHPDGQVKDEDFELASFLGSRMHDAGITCTTCHDPHRAELRKPVDTLCADCHDAQPGFQRHGHHPEGGADCVDCHMPVSTYMQRDPRRDHGFTLPDPALSLEEGVPNACNRCHEDRSARWSLAQLERWFPDSSPRPTALRARVIARLERTDPTVLEEALAAIAREPNDYWRAVLVGQLAPFGRDPRVLAHAKSWADADDALMRAKVGELLAPHSDLESARVLLEPLARDPVRAVRVSAQRALALRRGPKGPRMKDLLAYLDANADQPAAARERGWWLLAHREPEAARVWLQRAVQWDPEPVIAWRHLAAAAWSSRDPEGAIRALESGLAHHPEDAGLTRDLATLRARRTRSASVAGPSTPP